MALLAGARAAAGGGATLLRADRRGAAARVRRVAARAAVDVRSAAGRDGTRRFGSARTRPAGRHIHVVGAALFNRDADARRGVLRPVDGRAAVDGNARLADLLVTTHGPAANLHRLVDNLIAALLRHDLVGALGLLHSHLLGRLLLHHGVPNLCIRLLDTGHAAATGDGHAGLVHLTHRAGADGHPGPLTCFDADAHAGAALLAGADIRLGARCLAPGRTCRLGLGPIAASGLVAQQSVRVGRRL